MTQNIQTILFIIVFILAITGLILLLSFDRRRRARKLWQRTSAKSLWEERYTPAEMVVVERFLTRFCAIVDLPGYEQGDNIFKLRPDEKAADILDSVRSVFDCGMEELEFVVVLEQEFQMDIEAWGERFDTRTELPTFGEFIDDVIAYGNIVISPLKEDT